ncbi:Lipoprotein signal peptidase [Enhygromyxa salina]|uniref:Lipoprotein signal peptidase n=1 Tax=Enhygromyxa salina TaxID=215803 RepID=A0A0C2D4H0_9BACT|nr:signal peptidase II [Enhygromyxa salina]KIG16580.1 Lipoprotein signal peptidase [Enhygromyxa salina]
MSDSTTHTPHARRLSVAALVFVLSLALDQWSKQWAVTSLREQPAKPVIDGALVFDYAFNTGSAFGMFADHPAARTFFIVTTVLALAYMAALTWRLPGSLTSPRVAYGGTLGLTLMASGALGNLIDRLLRLDTVRVRFGDHLPFWLITEHPTELAQALLRPRNYVDVPRHGVVDFIVVYYWPTRRWPTFNIADVCLVIGVALFLIYLARQPRSRDTPGLELPSA